jgi:hypothetical protein
LLQVRLVFITTWHETKEYGRGTGLKGVMKMTWNDMVLFSNDYHKLSTLRR